MFVCLFIEVLSGSLYAPMLQGRMRNHQHLWNLLNDLAQSTNTWGRKDLNGEGFFPPAQFSTTLQEPWISVARIFLLSSGISTSPFLCCRRTNSHTNSCPLPTTPFIFSFKTSKEDFPGGAVDQNLPASAGDVGWIPGSGRFHMPKSNEAGVLQVLKPKCPDPMLQ